MDWWTELLQQRLGSTGSNPLGVPKVDVGAAKLTQSGTGGTGGTALQKTTGDIGTAAAVMAGAQALAGLGNLYYGGKTRRAQMRIKQAEQGINKALAQDAFERKMTGYFQAHSDLREQATQQMMEEQKVYRAKQAQLQVMQSERGMEGQSRSDTHQALTASHYAYQQITLGNLEKAERRMMYEREAILDQRFAQEAGFAINAAQDDEVSPFTEMLGGSLDVGLGALDTYLRFMA